VFKDLFRSKPKYVTVRPQKQTDHLEHSEKKEIPGGLWIKCDKCSNILYKKDLEKSLYVCPKCGFHFVISAKERITLLVDEGCFSEFDSEMKTIDPLSFPDYLEKLQKYQEETGMKDAIITGLGKIKGQEVVLAAIDYNFMRGSMNTVVGEKIVRAFELAREKHLPVTIVSGGGGGARMQEGVFSLMQMARTCQAAELHSKKNLLFIAVLTQATMGGVYASFASMADIILAEPGALIGFAGPRIIQQTMKQNLPEGFQTAEYVYKHGHIDRIVPRPFLKDTLANLIAWHRR
jgi:acetyl-CoA carboxylase carboxyl transferase subunit beta